LAIASSPLSPAIASSPLSPAMAVASSPLSPALAIASSPLSPGLAVKAVTRLVIVDCGLCAEQLLTAWKGDEYRDKRRVFNRFIHFGLVDAEIEPYKYRNVSSP